MKSWQMRGLGGMVLSMLATAAGAPRAMGDIVPILDLSSSGIVAGGYNYVYDVELQNPQLPGQGGVGPDQVLNPGDSFTIYNFADYKGVYSVPGSFILGNAQWVVSTQPVPEPSGVAQYLSVDPNAVSVTFTYKGDPIILGPGPTGFSEESLGSFDIESTSNVVGEGEFASQNSYVNGSLFHGGSKNSNFGHSNEGNDLFPDFDLTNVQNKYEQGVLLGTEDDAYVSSGIGDGYDAVGAVYTPYDPNVNLDALFAAETTTVPLPQAVWAFPAALGVAFFFARRLRRSTPTRV